MRDASNGRSPITPTLCEQLARPRPVTKLLSTRECLGCYRVLVCCHDAHIIEMGDGSSACRDLTITHHKDFSLPSFFVGDRRDFDPLELVATVAAELNNRHR